VAWASYAGRKVDARVGIDGILNLAGRSMLYSLVGQATSKELVESARDCSLGAMCYGAVISLDWFDRKWRF